MPGYIVHFASCGFDSLKNRTFVLGVETPDLLKYYYLHNGIEHAREKYNLLRTIDMPKFDTFLPRLMQKEVKGIGNGLHYGASSSPDVWKFWSSLSEEQKDNPFYRGYVWHLLTDALVYAKLKVEDRFTAIREPAILNHLDTDKLHREETQKIHSDWTNTNKAVLELYPIMTIPKEVLELNIEKPISAKLFYVDISILRECIEYLRLFNPLDCDMERTIAAIMDHLAN